ncbi:SPFH domain-containing protein [uncultured Abyssibacter sp.]|uniref:SPFH domain-containing protein n=1 Tax=uncultured Abyssibacter sp. TaxID=2320202 RepID=UPI0032B11319
MNIGITAVLIVVAVLLLIQAVVIVQPKRVKTITRFGKFVRVARPGLNFKIPLFIEMVDVQLSTALLHEQETVRVKTKDNAYVDMPLQVFYEVDESTRETVYAAAYNLEDAAQQILSLAAKEVRSHATSMKLDELFEDKDQIENNVMRDLEAFVSNNGFHIRNVVVDEPTPSEEIQAASNDVIASLRQQDAATAKAEAIRIERVGEAKADAQALMERAGAFAESRETIAQGMVRAAKTMGDNVRGLDDRDVMRVLEGVDWRDALISCSKGEGTIIIDSATGGHGIADTAGLVRALSEKNLAAKA